MSFQKLLASDGNNDARLAPCDYAICDRTISQVNCRALGRVSV